MPELVPISCSGPRVNCGLQLAWNQHNLTLIAGGDSKVRLINPIKSNLSWLGGKVFLLILYQKFNGRLPSFMPP